jgi:hypothetical protein
MAEEGRDEKGRFQRGNLFAVNNNGGAPPIYTNHKDMSDKLAEYLDYEDYISTKGKGKGTYTIEGAALYLGFASRQSMYDYEKLSSEFSYTVNRFRLFLTNWNAKKLYWGQTFSGAQFWLRNNGGYSDESTVNQNQTVTEVTIVEKLRDEA